MTCDKDHDLGPDSLVPAPFDLGYGLTMQRSLSRCPILRFAPLINYRLRIVIDRKCALDPTSLHKSSPRLNVPNVLHTLNSTGNHSKAWLTFRGQSPMQTPLSLNPLHSWHQGTKLCFVVPLKLLYIHHCKKSMKSQQTLYAMLIHHFSVLSFDYKIKALCIRHA
jgi:hypothetical protein